MIRDHKNTIYRMLSFIINTFQELPFYLPPYSPHLNIIERLWKELKARWIRPEDYLSADDLFYAVNNCLNQVGDKIKTNFKQYY